MWSIMTCNLSSLIGENKKFVHVMNGHGANHGAIVKYNIFSNDHPDVTAVSFHFSVIFMQHDQAHIPA